MTHDYEWTHEEIMKALFDVYMACCDIPGWINKLRPDFDSWHIEYFGRMEKLEELKARG